MGACNVAYLGTINIEHMARLELLVRAHVAVANLELAQHVHPPRVVRALARSIATAECRVSCAERRDECRVSCRVSNVVLRGE